MLSLPWGRHLGTADTFPTRQPALGTSQCPATAPRSDSGLFLYPPLQPAAPVRADMKTHTSVTLLAVPGGGPPRAAFRAQPRAGRRREARGDPLLSAPRRREAEPRPPEDLEMQRRCHPRPDLRREGARSESKAAARPSLRCGRHPTTPYPGLRIQSVTHTLRDAQPPGKPAPRPEGPPKPPFKSRTRAGDADIPKRMLNTQPRATVPVPRGAAARLPARTPTTRVPAPRSLPLPVRAAAPHPAAGPSLFSPQARPARDPGPQAPRPPSRARAQRPSPPRPPTPHAPGSEKRRTHERGGGSPGKGRAGAARQGAQKPTSTGWRAAPREQQRSPNRPQAGAHAERARLPSSRGPPGPPRPALAGKPTASPHPQNSRRGPARRQRPRGWGGLSAPREPSARTAPSQQKLRYWERRRRRVLPPAGRRASRVGRRAAPGARPRGPHGPTPSRPGPPWASQPPARGPQDAGGARPPASPRPPAPHATRARVSGAAGPAPAREQRSPSTRGPAAKGAAGRRPGLLGSGAATRTTAAAVLALSFLSFLQQQTGSASRGGGGAGTTLPPGPDVAHAPRPSLPEGSARPGPRRAARVRSGGPVAGAGAAGPAACAPPGPQVWLAEPPPGVDAGAASLGLPAGAQGPRSGRRRASRGRVVTRSRRPGPAARPAGGCCASARAGGASGGSAPEREPRGRGVPGAGGRGRLAPAPGRPQGKARRNARLCAEPRREESPGGAARRPAECSASPGLRGRQSGPCGFEAGSARGVGPGGGAAGTWTGAGGPALSPGGREGATRGESLASPPPVGRGEGQPCALGAQ
ncbi:collagen alpha-1(I) chain-like [Hippopotamus amphibius kiboko]|uniref:collagen alpha-1(I) chain-like n=1 Tax=Hippopotamus amphibius kiboko TaxID=575201 RepID=UPI002594D160|nr:collagen alpha-1(I) chain-like [Hippopotamus amphibius kiboko]